MTPSPRPARVPVRAAVLAAVAALVLAACSSTATQVLPVGEEAPGAAVPVAGIAESEPVVPSAIYAAQVGDAAQADRLAELSAIVERLRADSTSGWQVVQSDGRGYAQEVSGGRLSVPGTPAAAVEEFLARYGGLFGPASGFTYAVSESDDQGHVTVRVEQAVAGVPVDGALLVASVRERGGASEVQSVAGELVDVSGVGAQPGITAAEAESVVAQALGVEPREGAVLLVTTGEGSARLAWAVTVETGPPSGGESSAGDFLGLAVEYPALVFVDAQDGSVLGIRTAATSPTGRQSSPTGRQSSPTVRQSTAAIPGADKKGATSAVDYGNYDFEIPPNGRPVVIKTDYLGLVPIEVNAQQLPDGSIVLVDLTGPKANRATKKGAIVVLDGGGSGGRVGQSVADSQLVRYPNVESIPKDALYAMWGVRSTLDYLYERLGVLSFDGRNSPVPVVVNYTEGDQCLDNAFFLTAPGQSHMAVGVPCADEQGNRLPTLADIDTIAHELGHGLLHSHTFTRTTIQQGAIDEGTADFLGAVLRNGVIGSVSPVSSADVCRDYPGESSWCLDWADGRGIRSLNTGATFDDYAFTLEDPFNNTLLQLFSDSGHTNSMVWTNALWQARKAVASVDGGDLATSARAREFDRALFRAATRFAPGTDFVQASEEIVRSATELGMSAQEISLIRDRFRALGLCRGCQQSATDSAGVTPVTVSTNVKSSPVVVGDQVAYLLATADTSPGAAVATPGSPKQKRLGPPASLTTTVAGHSDRVVQTQVTFGSDGNIADVALGWANPRTGAYGVVTDNVDVFVTPAVSAEATVWVDDSGAVVFEPRDGGGRSRLPADIPVAQIATSGDRVAVLTADGTLWAWTVSSDELRKLAIFDPAPLDSFRSDALLFPVGSLAMAGDRIAVVGSTYRPTSVLVFDLAKNTKTTIAGKAVPLGLAINDDLVVWVEVTGAQDSPIYGEDPEATGFPDTELRGYAFADERQYRMVNLRGQQGFPSLGDTRLAWQESANGNSDIYSVPVTSQ